MKVYSFHNQGTIYFFKPEKTAYDIRVNKRQSALDFHINLVNEADDPAVFICDDRGVMIYHSSKPVNHVPMAEWNRINNKKNRKR